MNAKPFFGQFSVRGYVNYDKHVVKYLKTLPDQFSYQAIEDVVKADAEKNTSNNDLGMENYFYNTQIKKDLKKLKDSQKNFTYLKSPEYNDLQLVLTQFSKSKVNPILSFHLLIKMDGLCWFTRRYVPTNGAEDSLPVRKSRVYQYSRFF